MIDFDPYFVTSIFVVVFLIQLIIGRKHSWNIIDPLFFFIISTSFALTLAFLIIEDIWLISRIVLDFVFFWIGIGAGAIGGSRRIVANNENLELFIPSLVQLKLVVIIGIVFLIFGNVVVWEQNGAAIFTNNPSLAKFENFQEGYGWVRRLNWSVQIYLIFSVMFGLIYRKTAFWLLMLGILIGLSLISGSKSSLLPFVFSVGILMANPLTSVLAKKRYSWWVISLFMILSLVAAILVLYVENDSMMDTLKGLLIRLLFYGDSLIYWHLQEVRSVFNDYSSWNYPAYISNGILGLFRLVPYEEPLGHKLVVASFKHGEHLLDAFGPNVPFYVKGEIFFGPLGGIFYSFFIGMIISKVRNAYLRQITLRPLKFVGLGTLVMMVFVLPTEDSLFMTQVFDLFIFGIPILLLATFVFNLFWRPKNL